MATSFKAHAPSRARGNGQTDDPIAGAHAPHAYFPAMHEAGETYSEANWFASIFKAYWHVLLMLVVGIFSAGIAWQKLQASQDKIENVAKQVQNHDGTLTEIKESVAIVRGILEGEQRRALVAGPPLAPQGAPTSIRGRRAPLRPQRSIAWFNLR